MCKVSLTKLQREIMTAFYSLPKMKVIYDKKERNFLWKSATKHSIEDLSEIKSKCPALAHQIIRSYESKQNIQSAVFSECVYAQTFANLFGLTEFVNCFIEYEYIPNEVENLLNSYHLHPRYAYSVKDKSKMLIQAGGCGGIDSAFIIVSDLNIYTIEFKEPGAKTSEPDLPEYGEDGNLVITDDFLTRYPQFEAMLNEHKDLNFFNLMGNNEHTFSEQSVNIAITDNYIKKYADVVCTEDINGYFVMIPANQISQWAKIEGEIRPAGRNHYNVWTPNALRNFLEEKGAIINDNEVTVDVNSLGSRKQRGGNGVVSGFKINPLFFVYYKSCSFNEEMVTFNLDAVQQLKPTIAGKMFFSKLQYDKVQSYYFNH